MENELRNIGINAVGDMPWGTHFCYFYETTEDLLDTLAPYFKAGLENKEFCLWVVFEPLTAEDAKQKLRQLIPDLDRYLEAQSLEILPETEWYLKEGGFDQHRVIQSWLEKLEQALARGYVGMRATGNTGWLKQGWKDFAAYEEQLNQTIANQRIIVLCPYPIAASGAAEVLDVVRAHQFTVARRQGQWEVIEIAELQQAKQEIKRLNEELEERIIERTTELASTNKDLRREILDRQQTEDALRKQQEILQKIFDYIPVMINFIGIDRRMQLVNRAWEQTLGWTLEEIQEQDIDIFIACYPDPQERQRVLKFVEESNGEWADFKPKVRDGRVIDASWAMVHLSDGTAIGIGQDITERKRAEEELRATGESLRSLSASLSLAIEEERGRIARELHDELGSTLTSLKWDLEGIDKLHAEADTQAKFSTIREKIAGMLGRIDATINTVKRISVELRPTILDDLGLVAAIEWQAQQFEERTGIICQFHAFAENVELTWEQATAIFRILQESLTNILRHAQATKVNITLKAEEGELILEVRDNGRGLTEAEKSSTQALGLLGMRERTRIVGGKIEISGVAQQGTVLTVRIPVPNLL